MEFYEYKTLYLSNVEIGRWHTILDFNIFKRKFSLHFNSQSVTA